MYYRLAEYPSFLPLAYGVNANVFMEARTIFTILDYPINNSFLCFRLNFDGMTAKLPEGFADHLQIVLWLVEIIRVRGQYW